MRIAMLAGLAVAAQAQAQAQAQTIPPAVPQTIDLAAPGPATALLREVFPGLDREGRAPASRPVPSAPDATAPWEADAPVDLSGATMVSVRGKDESWRFAMAAGVLMVARNVPGYRYHGALFVQSDPGGPPSIERAFLAAPGLPMVLVGNRHFNSQEGFENFALYALVKGRLTQVYDGPSLYSVSIGSEKCDYLRTQQRLDRFQPVKAGAVLRIEMRVVEERICETAKGSRILRAMDFPIRLTWNVRTHRFTGRSPALEKRNRDRG